MRFDTAAVRSGIGGRLRSDQPGTRFDSACRAVDGLARLVVWAVPGYGIDRRPIAERRLSGSVVRLRRGPGGCEELAGRAIAHGDLGSGPGRAEAIRRADGLQFTESFDAAGKETCPSDYGTRERTYDA